jgi:hypothetical protein
MDKNDAEKIRKDWFWVSHLAMQIPFALESLTPEFIRSWDKEGINLLLVP